MSQKELELTVENNELRNKLAIAHQGFIEIKSMVLVWNMHMIAREITKVLKQLETK